MKALRWLLAAMLLVLAAAFTMAALDRPYADNQRNWLLIIGVLSVLAFGVVLFARPMLFGSRDFFRAVIREWKPRE